MAVFHIAAMLLALAAIIGYINHRLLKLPHTIGLMVITLGLSVGVIAFDALAPGFGIKQALKEAVEGVDFSTTLLQVMLCFLLFAGALHVKLEHLLKRKWAIGTLATVGVLISTALVGGLAWIIFNKVFELGVGFGPCLIFGALISPTDPVAVLGLLKTARAPASLEAKIAGESLFNDGVGVVLFTVLVAVILPGEAGEHAVLGAGDVAVLFLVEVAGGVVVGLAGGYVAFRLLKTIDHYQLEVLITLALVMGVNSLAVTFHFSGPIAVVLAGLLLGNYGKRFAMSPVTVDHMEKFWLLIDEILNSVLFLLIGLEVFLIPMKEARILEAALLVVPAVLLARFISVSVPITLLSRWREFTRGVIPVLTWSGLRGGISVALVLSLKEIKTGDPQLHGLLIASTYAVVLFSVIVQGLTVKPLLKRILKPPGV